MLELGGEWGADYWANTGDTSVSAGNHVSDISPGLGTVFWADIEGNYTIDTKLISAKQKELYSNEESIGILKNAYDERVVSMDKSQLFTSTHMTVGCDTGIMLIDLRRSNVALELLNVIRNDVELLATSRGDKDV
ncbi:hypothetical protein SARC_03723 [Sphaeroforma arctica JP610]|uniref:Uncharacterized protein n=1 Tax=Sphaeroforma arctica JP610 TaxID=667725 RepID=A0A0L0G5I8_9EUKA|nr:hypothetical protein SARC_03723 [Sphaeroforma arctica JP610]KNC84061.1 hypothetical protein SARC_03723 [Sphaeroforma arctica JP610]|eukprot:XP_014157963.1 hypothetical protein SARC_03723 [Sphaeroforma arctica JP610]